MERSQGLSWPQYPDQRCLPSPSSPASGPLRTPAVVGGPTSLLYVRVPFLQGSKLRSQRLCDLPEVTWERAPGTQLS